MMSFDLPQQGTLPNNITTTTRDVVSGHSVTANSTGSSNDNMSRDAPPTPALPGASSKKRRVSKGRITKPGQRSLSTPHLRGLVMSDAEADKKRNKLGYQRISIACAHCRRRKIRCLIAENDPHGRCSNCIRLKKECVFYPVDQQGVPENRPLTDNSGMGSGSSSGISQSPPDIGTTHFEPRTLGAFQTLPSNAPASYSGLPVGLPTQPDDDRPINMGGRAYSFAGSLDPLGPGYRSQTDSNSPWPGAGPFQYHMSSNTQSPPDLPNTNYWRHNPVSSPGDYAPFPFTFEPTATPPTTQSTNPFAFSQPRNDSMWSQPHHQQPVRSMSYSQVEGYAQNIDPYNAFQQGVLHQPTAVRPLPPALDIQNATMMPQASAPRSAPIEQQHLHDLHAFSMHYNANGMPPTTNQGLSHAFYQQSPRLGTVQEEQGSPGLESGRFSAQATQPG